jgi:hypothetical protein
VATHDSWTGLYAPETMLFYDLDFLSLDLRNTDKLEPYYNYPVSFVQYFFNESETTLSYERTAYTLYDAVSELGGIIDIGSHVAIFLIWQT